MSIQVNKVRIIIYFIVISACLVFASYYGGPVSYAPLYGALLIFPVSAAYIFLNFRFLRVYQEIEVHRFPKGEDHRYRAVIENAGFLPVHKMRLYTHRDRCDLYEIEDGQILSLDIREKKELISGISCKYAGSYDIGLSNAALTDPFSIFTVVVKIPYNFRAVVSPRITDIADSYLDLENLVNSTGLKSNWMTEETPGSDWRPYQRGDALNSVNWKVSAKLSELTVRIPDKMEKRTVTILMEAANVPDNCQELEFLKKRDYFLEFIVSAAWHFAKQGVPVHLIYPSGKVSESEVESYENFMEFYNTVADGIFYHSEEEYNKIRSLVMNRGSSWYDNNTWILIREDPEPGESHCTVCD